MGDFDWDCCFFSKFLLLAAADVSFLKLNFGLKLSSDEDDEEEEEEEEDEDDDDEYFLWRGGGVTFACGNDVDGGGGGGDDEDDGFITVDSLKSLKIESII